jgi:hypothetical protein
VEWIILGLVVLAVVYLVRAGGQKRARAELGARSEADLGAVRRVADEDVTRFGEELQRLDTELLTETLDEPTRQDYQRALDSYESAKESLRLTAHPDDIRHVTQALEDGRYAVACVRARTQGEPLPVRRPPCFFNPAHGPSTTDMEWAPPGGRPRQIPVCAADADRITQGADPDVRTVPRGVGRVPYWQAGPAYSPWASGYFSGYATSGLLPGFLLGTLLSPGWDGGGWDDGWGFGDGPDADPGGYDSGYDGSDAGGDGGGFDFGDGGFDL